MKVCGKCGVEQPLDNFFRRSENKELREGTCKDCKRQRSQAWYADNKELQRDRTYRKVYGISLEEYEKLKEFQGGRCAICRRISRKKNMAVDHNHKTGEVRGLLCDWCNRRLLGACHEKIEVLEQAIQYLREPPARKVLDKDVSLD